MIDKTNLPKARIHGKFVGKLSKRKGLDYGVYLPGDHLLNIALAIFNNPDITMTTLQNIYNDLSKKGRVDEDIFYIERYIVGTLVPNYSPITTTSSVTHPDPAEASTSSPTITSTIGTQTWHSQQNFLLVSKVAEDRSSTKIAELTSTLKTLTDKIEVLEADNNTLKIENEQLKGENSLMTTNIAKLTLAATEQSNKLKEAKQNRMKLLNECRALEDQLCQYESTAGEAVDDLTQNPDVELDAIFEQYKSILELADPSISVSARSTLQIPMRTSRKNINPKITLAITILRQIGHCSLEKTTQTLVLLGKLFSKNLTILKFPASFSSTKMA